MDMPGLAEPDGTLTLNTYEDNVHVSGAEAATAYGQQPVAGGKRVSIRFTAERQHSIDFGKLAA